MKTSEKIKSCPEHTEDRPKKETTVIKKKPVKKMPDHVADAILASAGIDADKELQRAMDTVARYEKDWERNRELVRENEVLRSHCDHLSSENASLARQAESMAMRIESLAEELAKPEDMRLREVLEELDGRAVIFDGLGERVGHLLDEMDEWIGRAGEAERMVEAARRSLSSVAESMTEHAYQELASALESPPRIAGKTADFDPPGREYTTGDALGLRRDR